MSRFDPDISDVVGHVQVSRLFVPENEVGCR